MSTKKRPVEFFRGFGFRNGEKKMKGKFHEWGIGNESQMLYTPNYQDKRTLGICENEEGQIFLIDPKRIKFLDKQ